MKHNTFETCIRTRKQIMCNAEHWDNWVHIYYYVDKTSSQLHVKTTCTILFKYTLNSTGQGLISIVQIIVQYRQYKIHKYMYSSILFLKTILFYTLYNFFYIHVCCGYFFKPVWLIFLCLISIITIIWIKQSKIKIKLA